MNTLPSIAAPITALYAALLGLLFCALTVRVVCLRIRLKATLGHAGDARLRRAVRVHGNFAEHVPLALLLLLLLELAGASPWLLHGGGGLLLLARAAHAYGVSQLQERLGWRLAGMVGTFTVLSCGAVGLLLVPLGWHRWPQ